MTQPTSELLERARAHLVLCGPCDLGCCQPCVCPPEGPRAVIQDLIAAVEHLSAAGNSEGGSRAATQPQP